MERGFVRTGWKTYQPELDDDLLDGHGWLCKEHRKAIWHTTDTKPLPPRKDIIQFSNILGRGSFCRNFWM